MARPTKEQQEKLKEIISTGLVSRNHYNYTSFEDELGKESKYLKPYLFCLSCEFRSDYKNNTLDYLNKLVKYNKHMYNFEDDYYPITLVPTYTVLESLTIERFDEVVHNCDYTMGFLRFDQLKDLLTEDELHEVFYHATEDHTFDIITIIKPIRYNLQAPYFKNGEISKKAFVQIDFTKPLEDIQETIKEIKEKFDKDPNYIKSPFEVIDSELEPYMCSIEECDIFKHKSPKPLEGKMADLLFIYDCKAVGLSEKYITDEISKYWKETKKIFNEDFYSFDSYYKQAKKLIDEKEYKCFLHGVKTDLFDNYSPH